jgi:chromosome segregation ATPase
MRKILLFERRKSKEKSDAAEVNGLDDKTGLAEGNEEKPEELWVEADTNDVDDALPETDVLENLGQLRRELKEFEKLRGGIRTTISSIKKLVPRLKENKERLMKDMDEKRKGVEQLTQQIPQLNKQKTELLQTIEQKQEQKQLLENDIDAKQKEVEYLTNEIPKLKAQETTLLHRIQQNQKDLIQINDQINEVTSIQKYGIDFVSALVYASQKSKH